MPSEDEIQSQLSLLATYRRTLTTYRRQQAELGTLTPPGVINGIFEARTQIRRIKTTLRQWEISVEDYPEDSEPATKPRSNFGPPVKLYTSSPNHRHKPVHISSEILGILILISIIVFGVLIYALSRIPSNTIVAYATPLITPHSVSPPSLSPMLSPPLTPIVLSSTPRHSSFSESISTTITAAPTVLPTVVKEQMASTTPVILSGELAWARSCPSLPQVLPSYINPSQNMKRAIEQITLAYKDNSIKSWTPVGTHILTPTLFILLNNTIEPNKQAVWLENRLLISIFSRRDIPDHIDVVDFIDQCAGKGMVQLSPDASLQSDLLNYEIIRKSSEFDYFSLKPGDFEGFQLSFNCMSPGIYDVRVNIEYRYLNQFNSTILNSPSTIFCPKSYTVWHVNHDWTYFDTVQNFTWNGKEYVETQ